MLMQPVHEQNIPGDKNGDYSCIQQSVPKNLGTAVDGYLTDQQLHIQYDSIPQRD